MRKSRQVIKDSKSKEIDTLLRNAQSAIDKNNKLLIKYKKDLYLFKKEFLQLQILLKDPLFIEKGFVKNVLENIAFKNISFIKRQIEELKDLKLSLENQSGERYQLPKKAITQLLERYQSIELETHMFDKHEAIQLQIRLKQQSVNLYKLNHSIQRGVCRPYEYYKRKTTSKNEIINSDIVAQIAKAGSIEEIAKIAQGLEKNSLYRIFHINFTNMMQLMEKIQKSQYEINKSFDQYKGKNGIWDITIINPKDQIEAADRKSNWIKKHKAGDVLFMFNPSNQQYEVHLIISEKDKFDGEFHKKVQSITLERPKDLEDSDKRRSFKDILYQALSDIPTSPSDYDLLSIRQLLLNNSMSRKKHQLFPNHIFSPVSSEYVTLCNDMKLRGHLSLANINSIFSYVLNPDETLKLDGMKLSDKQRNIFVEAINRFKSTLELYITLSDRIKSLLPNFAHRLATTSILNLPDLFRELVVNQQSMTHEIGYKPLPQEIEAGSVRKQTQFESIPVEIVSVSSPEEINVEISFKEDSSKAVLPILETSATLSQEVQEHWHRRGRQPTLFYTPREESVINQTQSCAYIDGPG